MRAQVLLAFQVRASATLHEKAEKRLFINLPWARLVSAVSWGLVFAEPQNMGYMYYCPSGSHTVALGSFRILSVVTFVTSN